MAGVGQPQAFSFLGQMDAGVRPAVAQPDLIVDVDESVSLAGVTSASSCGAHEQAAALNGRDRP